MGLPTGGRAGILRQEPAVPVSVTLGVTHLLFAVQAASIAGTVRDGLNGAPVPGAVVALHDLERSTLTDPTGRYVFLDVPAGPQHLMVRRIGYAPRTLHALVPSHGNVEIDITLRSHPMTLAAVEARGAVPVRGLEDTDSTGVPDRAVSMAAVRHHPLLAEPDALAALDGGEVATRPEAPSGLHVRGGGADQVAYLLDGVPVFNPYYTTGSFSTWNPDALSGVALRAAAPGYADALSGVVTGTTREPGASVVMQGSLSTTHTGVAVDGPLGRAGAGYLFSRRYAFAGFPAPKRESSYLHNDAGDWMLKLESPLLGGQGRLLAVENESEIGAAVVPQDSAVPVARHRFGWRGLSAGGGWSRRFPGGGISVRAWSAQGSANGTWRASDSTLQHLAADRRDLGIAASVDVESEGARTTVGFRSERSETFYGVRPLSGPGPTLDLGAVTPVSALFIEHAQTLSRAARLELSVVGAVAAGDPYVSPRAAVRWTAGPVLFRAEIGRLHQFTQSLRNPESVVSTIFPADLPLGVGGSAIPVARSDQAIIAADFRPTAGMRVAAQLYARDFEGLALPAAYGAGPFAMGFVVGSGGARGGALELGVNGARFGALASYGLQHVRLEYGDSSYVPDHGATHSLDAGVTYFPSPTWSLRLGGSGLWGRRTTAVSGPFEWESCNLLDRGCEFAGSPQQRAEPLGATPLPAYVRLDVGVRKHWHVHLAGRDGLVAVYGTVTNVLGHANVLTVTADPATGARSTIGMRPRAPLVVGIDWRY